MRLTVLATAATIPLAFWQMQALGVWSLLPAICLLALLKSHFDGEAAKHQATIDMIDSAEAGTSKKGKAK